MSEIGDQNEMKPCRSIAYELEKNIRIPIIWGEGDEVLLGGIGEAVFLSLHAGHDGQPIDHLPHGSWWLTSPARVARSQ